MDQWLRWLTAVAVFFIVFTGSFAVAGAQAAQEAPPEDSPAWFETAPSRVGDKGLYKTALVIVKDGQGEYIDMNARYAFERLPDEVMLGADGRLVATESFVAEWRTEYYDMVLRDVLDLPPELDLPSVPVLDCLPPPPTGGSEQEMEDYQDALDDCLDEYDDRMDDYLDEVDDRVDAYTENMAQWVGLLDAPQHIVRASDWHVTHHAGNDTVATSFLTSASKLGSIEFKPSLIGQRAPHEVDLPALTLTEPLPVPGPCGWRTSLQDGPRDMWDPILVHGECPPDMDLGFAEVDHVEGPIAMVVSGQDTVDGRETVVFSMAGAEDKLRLWFTEDTAYPLRVLTKTTSVPKAIADSLGSGYRAPAFYVLHELVSFQEGVDTAPITVPSAPAAKATDTPWGPDASALAHPWPLAAAVAETREDVADCGDWRDWLAAHPDAVAIRASYNVLVTPDPEHDDPVVDETWLVRASDGASAVNIALHRHTETTADLPTMAVRVPDTWCAQPAPASLTEPRGPLADIPGAMARLNGLGGAGTDYGWEGGVLHIEQGPYAPTPTKTFERLAVDQLGGLMQWARTDSGYPSPTFGDPQWRPDAEDDWAIHPAGQGAWVMPRAATAAALTGAAVSAGALVLIIPALKGLFGMLPMFSRIRKEDLLEHPVRGTIYDAIQADPGIHFQELVRRVGKGRGTMEHHIRKMVAADLLVEKANKGFNCFFPKGEVDRRLMDAAPLLKGDGGRNVLAAICGQPGIVALQVAEHLGMSTSTVNYHVKRLTEAGLVQAERQGRFVVLQGTGLGAEALGRFGRT